MTDGASIAAFLGSVKTAVDIAKAVRDTGVTLERAEAKLKLAELIEALADAKIQASDIQDILREKDTQIAELKAAFELKAKLVRNLDAYYIADSKGEPTGPPFCSHCWESSQKAIHLYLNGRNWTRDCPACKAQYQQSHAPDMDNPEPQGPALSIG